MLNLKKGKLIGFCINGKKKVTKKIHFEFPEEATGLWKKKETDDKAEGVRDQEAAEEDKEVKAREITTDSPDEKMEPFYNPKERITMFIAGTQGCGKSYFISEFLDDYKLAHPERPVRLFTGLVEKDKHFERHADRIVVPKMRAKYLERIDLETLRYNSKKERTGCLLVFDDVDRIRDDEVRKLTYKILYDALCNGRDHETQEAYADIDVVVTNHEINDYQNTKYILTECNYIVLYPYFTTAEQIERVLKKIGVGKSLMKKIIEYQGRALIIHRTAPMYCITHSKIFLLK